MKILIKYFFPMSFTKKTGSRSGSSFFILPNSLFSKVDL